MFASDTPQLESFANRIETNMSASLNESCRFFSDNVMITASSDCYPGGDTFHGEATDCEYSKGIYNLRPRGAAPPHTAVSPRFELEKPPAQAAKAKRPRNSLKKRLLVNARERDRMRVLNNGFQALRDALPCYIADGHMAKITTLRLAINYIKALTEVLNDETPACTPISRCTQRSCGPTIPRSSTMIVVTTSQQDLDKPSLPLNVSYFSFHTFHLKCFSFIAPPFSQGANFEVLKSFSLLCFYVLSFLSSLLF